MHRLIMTPAFLALLTLVSCARTESTQANPSTANAAKPAPAQQPVRSIDTPGEPRKDQGAVATSGDAQKVNADALLLQEFKRRVDKYVSITQTAGHDAPPLKKTKDAAEIRTAQDLLGQRIRALNANAKHGDIFTPEIAALFRRLARPEVTEKPTKDAIKDDNPENIPYLKVNAIYPEKEALSTVPPNVLMALPMLPKDIEYRFVGKHLILRDVRANLIIDYIVNVMP